MIVAVFCYEVKLQFKKKTWNEDKLNSLKNILKPILEQEIPLIYEKQKTSIKSNLIWKKSRVIPLSQLSYV